MMKTSGFLWVVLLCGCGDEAGAPPQATLASVELAPPVEDGTPEHPYLVHQFPFVQDDDTSKSSVFKFDNYSAAPTIGEAGPEVYYRVTLAQAGTLKAELRESPGVDVDLQLLTGLGIEGKTSTQCLSRANTQLTAKDLPAGVYTLVVDSYSSNGKVYAGAYRVALELDVPDVWQVVDVAIGVTWKKKIYSNYAGGTQTVNVLAVDLAQPGLTVKPYKESSGIYPSKEAEEHAATAAINGGFFSSGYQSLCLVKIDGVVKAKNALGVGSQPAFGVTNQGSALFGSVAPNTDWTVAWQALGGHPNLVTGGQVDIWPAGSSSFYTSKHPRTALGLTSSGKLLFVTVDGRTAAGKGMTLNELAQLLVALGAEKAMNLDGGGSTTMWVKGKSINGIVNFPSDNQKADHWGERAVSDALLIHSP